MAKKIKPAKNLIPVDRIENKVILMRGQKVMLDRDLAELYGVETRAIIQSVKRNKDRFPDDFMFRLDFIETNQLVTNCDRLRSFDIISYMIYSYGRIFGKIL